MSKVQERLWLSQAIKTIEADFNRSADTHLFRVPLGGNGDVALYIKDESTHPSGSLKHRLARSLFLYALCNGWIGPTTTIVEASSGSTAVSEAYFARMLGLPFVAVMPISTAREKVDQDRPFLLDRRFDLTCDIRPRGNRFHGSGPHPASMPRSENTTGIGVSLGAKLLAANRVGR